MTEWRDTIVGARMAVDQEFNERVRESEFTGQQWGLIMTAVELQLEHPEDPDRATIVADTSKLDAVLPELDQVGREAAAMRAGRSPGSAGDRSGLLARLKQALGVGGSSPDRRRQRRAAAALAQEYATELQAHLEATDQWERVRQTASPDE